MKWSKFKEEYEIPKGLIPFLIGLIAVFIIGGSAVYIGLHGNPFKEYAIAHDVRQYLIEQKGYAQDDIASVEGTYSFKADKNAYRAMVIFTDEPKNVYEYHIDGNDHIANEQPFSTKHIHGDKD